MKLRSIAAKNILLCLMLSGLSGAAIADSILVEEAKGGLITLTQEGEPACGTVNWGSIRQPGIVTISGEIVEIKEAKLPLSKEQWEELLTKVAGEQKEITIANGWEKGPAALAAALRVAYDVRSHGGTAWVLNGRMEDNKPLAKCAGQYKFTGIPEAVYLTEDQFWQEYKNGKFLDARGRGSQEPPNYTWVIGTPTNGAAVDIATFTNNDKVDKDVYSCDDFKGFTVAGCDSLHKTFLAVEAAKFANCDSQPKLMPYWGLAGLSRSPKVAKEVWGKEVALNAKRTGEWSKAN